MAREVCWHMEYHHVIYIFDRIDIITISYDFDQEMKRNKREWRSEDSEKLLRKISMKKKKMLKSLENFNMKIKCVVCMCVVCVCVSMHVVFNSNGCVCVRCESLPLIEVCVSS